MIILIILAIIGGTIIDVFAELLEKEQRLQRNIQI